MHTTSKTHLKGEVNFSRERRAAGPEAAGQKSEALMEAYQGKLDRYSLLTAMVERQVLDGLRTAAPLVLPVVVSTHGECCPGTVQLQEWLVERYRARLRLEGERDDGEKEEDLITAFRCELRAALLVATAKGTAEMLAVAGRPFRKGAAQGSGTWLGARAPAACPAADISDKDKSNGDSDSDSDSDSAADSDSDRHSGTPSSDTTTTDSDGSSVTSRRSYRSAAPQGHSIQPRAGTRSSARLAQQRGSAQPESPDSAPGSLSLGGQDYISCISSGSHDHTLTNLRRHHPRWRYGADTSSSSSSSSFSSSSSNSTSNSSSSRSGSRSNSSGNHSCSILSLGDCGGFPTIT